MPEYDILYFLSNRYTVKIAFRIMLGAQCAHICVTIWTLTWQCHKGMRIVLIA
jgi:hypothetical protein